MRFLSLFHYITKRFWQCNPSLRRSHATKAYAAVVAGYTASIIILPAAVEETGGSSNIAFDRIVMDFVGVGIFVGVELLVLPKSARVLIWRGQSPILRLIAKATAEALASFSESRNKRDEPTENSEDCGAPISNDDDGDATSVRSEVSDLFADGGEVDSESSPELWSANRGQEAVSASLALLIPAVEEPDLWRLRFPKLSFGRVLDAEKRCFELLGALRDATARFDPAGLPMSVPLKVAVFAEIVAEATAHAAGAMNKWDDLRRVKRRGLCKGSLQCTLRCYSCGLCRATRTTNGGKQGCAQFDAFTNSLVVSIASASRLVAPLLQMRSRTDRALLEQRNLLVLLAFEGLAPSLPQSAVVGWMAVCFLCAELASALTRLGEALRDFRAEVTTPRV